MVVNNGIVGKFVVGTIITTAITISGWGIVNNEVRNVESHEEIRKETIVAVEKVVGKVDKLKDIVTDIRLEQRDLSNFIKAKL